MSLASASDVSMFSNIEHCSMDDKSMNMSTVGHLSGCSDTTCAQYLTIDKKVVFLERYIPQSLSVVFIFNTLYASFTSKVNTPPIV
ncbi:MAG: hypothetical protein Rsou_1029 [Candidatus Ruthia sp. Asou_11_S2]|nr:hypothetical protein [Candidatus Ruthia sp. Asou_11_S2]